MKSLKLSNTESDLAYRQFPGRHNLRVRQISNNTKEYLFEKNEKYIFRTFLALVGIKLLLLF